MLLPEKLKEEVKNFTDAQIILNVILSAILNQLNRTAPSADFLWLKNMTRKTARIRFA
jgi:hypothetical protein